MSKPGDGNFTQLATGALKEITYDPDTKTYRAMIEDGQSYLVTNQYRDPAYYTIYPPGAPEWGKSIRNVSAYSNLSYTSLASYFTDDGHNHSLAFGLPTPAGDVPKTGSAVFTGVLAGEGTMVATSGWGDWPYTPIGGTIFLDVNFGTGSLTGVIDPNPTCDCTGPQFSDYSFQALLTGNGFEGAFNAAVDPKNYIRGIFAGPSAQEAMGLWSLPITNGTGASAENHVISGAFAARRP